MLDEESEPDLPTMRQSLNSIFAEQPKGTEDLTADFQPLPG